MKAGDEVRLHSLLAAKHHNGKIGKLIQYDDNSGRWQIVLTNGDHVNVKPANLLQVGAGFVEQAAAAGAGEIDGVSAASQEVPSIDEEPPPWYDEFLDDEFVDSGIFDETFIYILKQIDTNACEADSPIAQLFGDGLATSMIHVAALGGDIPLLRALLRKGAVSHELVMYFPCSVRFPGYVFHPILLALLPSSPFSLSVSCSAPFRARSPYLRP